MVNTVTVHIEGLDALGEAMKDLGDKMHLKISRAATRAAGRLVLDAAKSLATEHVKTGELKKDIQLRRSVKASRPGFEVVSVGVYKQQAYYWRFQEFGTVKMAANPFLRPAFDLEKSSAVDNMAYAIATGNEKAVKK